MKLLGKGEKGSCLSLTWLEEAMIKRNSRILSGSWSETDEYIYQETKKEMEEFEGPATE